MTMPTQITPPPGSHMTRAASLEPSSFNEADQSFEVIWTTGATVRRYSWQEGEFDEALATDPSNVRLERLNGGAPVLANHDRFSLDGVVGSVVPGTARMTRGKGIARVRLADTPDVADIVAKVRAGHIRHVSVGYIVHAYQAREATEAQRKQLLATDWEPLEVSLVPVPADSGSFIRSENPNMTVPQNPPAAVISARDITTAVRNAGLSVDVVDELLDRHEQTPLSRDDLMAEVGRRFAARDTQLNIHNRVSPFPVTNDQGSPENMRSRMEDALYARMSGSTPPDHAREFMGASMVDLARGLLQARGERVQWLGSDAIAERSLHTTSDFPQLLLGAGNRYLIDVFQAATSEVKALARLRTATDFRDISVLKLSQAPWLEKVGEAGEIKHGTFSEGKETYKLSTFGKIFGLSRQAIINDNLGAFSDPLRLMARAAAETEAQELTALLLANGGAGANMADGKALYHADHGNKAAAGAALSVATLSDGRKAMRSQLDTDGKTPVNSVAKFLLVGPAIETTAEQVLATLAAAQVAEVNPFSGKLDLKVDPRLPGNAWRLFADPTLWPVLEYAYLNSAQGPQVAMREGWDVLGSEFRVSLDFGCGVVDHHGTYLNAGA